MLNGVLPVVGLAADHHSTDDRPNSTHCPVMGWRHSGGQAFEVVLEIAPAQRNSRRGVNHAKRSRLLAGTNKSEKHWTLRPSNITLWFLANLGKRVWHVG